MQTITPICSVLGHVDVGKTKLLDFLRSTVTIEESEITQRMSIDVINRETLEKLSGKNNLEIDRLVLIDTPGHNNFTTMRQIGTIISNLVIFVLDVSKGLEEDIKQCIKFVNDLHATNFIIVLNKIDKINGWCSIENASLKKTFKKNANLVDTLNDNINRIICQLAELEINACAYYNNRDPLTFVSMVPMSAKSGEGVQDLIQLISQMMARISAQHQLDPLSKYSHGYFLDTMYEDKIGNFNLVLNVESELACGDKLLIVNKDNMSVTECRIDSLVEMNNKNKNKKSGTKKIIQCVNSTCGVGITLDNQAILPIGSIYVKINDIEERDRLTQLLNNKVSKTNSNLMCEYVERQYGIFLYAPSANIMSALISMLNEQSIPIMMHSIGKITKYDIIKFVNAYDKINVSYEKQYLNRYRTILAFDLEDKLLNSTVNVINEKTIFNLSKKYLQYVEKCDSAFYAKYPNVGENFRLKILPEYVFMKTTPLLFGVKVLKGSIGVGTPVIATKNNNSVQLGNVVSIQKNKSKLAVANIGDEVCIRIDGTNKLTFGKDEDFDETYEIERFFNSDDLIIINFINNLMRF